MSIVHYAIEIDTGDATYTDADVGSVAGVIRYVTDRPGYDGLVPYPTWGAAERASGNITSVWYEGFLTKDGIATSSVSTDLSYQGSYSTTSNFQFTLSGSADLLAELDTAGLNIVGKPVKLFIVIDNVFYQRWGGIVARHEAGENGETTIYCEDNFQQLHKVIPPIALNKAQYPDLRQSDEGKSIPVCLGDVPYAKVQNAGADPAWQQMCRSEVADDAGNDKIYASPVIYASYNADDLVVLYLKTNISVDADQFNGMYAFVVFGEDSDDTYGVRVSDCTADTVGTGGGLFGSQQYFTITLEHPFSKTPVDINSTHLYSDATTADIWWVGIANLSARNAVSNGAIVAYGKNPSGMPILRNFNEESGVYDDISGLVQSANVAGKDGWPHPQIEFIRKSAEINGACNVFNFIPIDSYVIFGVRFYSRTNVYGGLIGFRPITFESIIRTGELEKIYVTGADDSMFTVSVDIPVEAINESYDDIYIAFDSSMWCYFNFRLEFLFTAVDAFGKQISQSSRLYFKRNGEYDLEKSYPTYGQSEIESAIGAGDTAITDVTDAADLVENAWAVLFDSSGFENPEWVYITDITGTTVTVRDAIARARVYTPPFRPVIIMGQDINFIPTRMYDVGSAPVYDTSTVFGTVENLDGTDYSHADAIKVPADIVEAIKNGWVTNQVSMTVYIKTEFETDDFAFLMKNLAIIGRREVNTLSGKIYTTVQGEPVSTDQTNNPVAMIKKIMQDYDRIPTTDIDYHTLTGSGGKNLWYAGGQLTERKSSFDYLNDICRQFWIAMFPSRLGKRKCADWLNHVDSAGTFTQDEILRGSIEPIEQRTDNVYNELTVKYGYSPGHGEYLKKIAVLNVDKPHYPPHPAEVTTASAAAGQKDVEVTDGSIFEVGDILRLTDNPVSYEDRCVVASISGDVLTMEDNLVYAYASGSFIVARVHEYVSGLVGGDAIALWNTCHNAYVRFGSKATMPDSDGELSLVPDYEYFGDLSKTESGSSAYYHIFTLAQWATRPKPIVRFAVPVTAANAILDISDLITFSDSLLLPVSRDGYIQAVTLDAGGDRILIEAVLTPDGYAEDVPGDIIEIGDATDTITESGSQTDTITEDGQ